LFETGVTPKFAREGPTTRMSTSRGELPSITNPVVAMSPTLSATRLLALLRNVFGEDRKKVKPIVIPLPEVSLW